MSVSDEIRSSFSSMARTAQRLGIEWKLTLSEFELIWKPQWHERRSKQLSLERRDCSKPFEIGNLLIVTAARRRTKKWMRGMGYTSQNTH
jgi:hypothetical protein